MSTAGASVVLDCRWLGISGAGRTTELVLRGLAEVRPPGRWVLWGPAAASAWAWPGTEIVRIDADPRQLLGQRHAFALPRADLTVFLHQQRPLRPVPAVSVIYDTIALRYGANRPVRALRRQFLRRVAASSRHVLTISEHSKASIVRDLGVAPERVEILRFPFDDAFASRVAARRSSLPAPEAEVALYVGAFLPHKNLPRLIAAFEASELCRDGGRLVLAGGPAPRAQELLDGLTSAQRRFVIVRQGCTQDDLDALFASSLFLVQPSLEEGFGLPAWEALSCGLPVCASDGGALPEVVQGFAEPFPATSTSAMTAAIDACATRARRASSPEDRAAQVDALRARAPTIRDFGHQFLTAIEGHALSSR